MGFDAREVTPDADVQQTLRDTWYASSVNDVLKQHQKMAREISGVDRMLRSFGGMGQVVRDAHSSSSFASSAARIAGTPNFMGANTASLYADLAKRVVPESLRGGVPALRRSLASTGFYPHPQSNALMIRRMLENVLGPQDAVSRALKLHGIASAYGGSWSLYRVPPIRTPALQSFLRYVPTTGPIVVSPDDEVSPSDYHPDLPEWLIPMTATRSGDALDVEQLWAETLALVVAIARHHRTEAIVKGVGRHGITFLVAVAAGALGDTVGQAVWYWLTHH